MTDPRFRLVSGERIAGIAPAKLNLFLEILGKRPDGYHELRTVFHEVDFADEIEVALAPGAPGDRLDCTGHALDIPPERNLVLHAAAAFRAEVRDLPPVSIRLRKIVPPGTGMGGGSADAAFVLRALNRLSGTPLAAAPLSTLAATIGADVAFFMEGGTALGRARGDQLTAIQGNPGLALILALPVFSLGTATVYAQADLRAPRVDVDAFVEGMRRLRRGDALTGCFNRLETAARRVEPRLGGVLDGLRAATRAPWTMTGSGSALFAPAADLEDAARLASRVTSLGHPDLSGVRVVRSFGGNPEPVGR